MEFKVGDRVRNTGRVYSIYAKEGTVVVASDSRGLCSVKFDGYNNLYCGEEAIELIEKGEAMAEKLYKVVHIDGEGKYSSAFCGQLCAKGTGDSHPKLQYRIGAATIAPKDSDGVYCHNTIEKAVKHADGTAGITIQPPTAILEVEPVAITGMFSIVGKPSAVKVIGEVWRKSEPVDITKDCKANLYVSDDGEALIRLQYRGTTVFEVGNGGAVWRSSKYSVETVSNPVGGIIGWFKVFKKV